MGSRKSSHQREDPNDCSTFRRKRSKDVGNLIPPSASNTSTSRLRIKKRSIQHSRSKSKQTEKRVAKDYRSYSAHQEAKKAKTSRMNFQGSVLAMKPKGVGEIPTSTLDTKGVLEKIQLVESQKFTARQPSTGGTTTTGRVKDLTDRYATPSEEETIRY